MRFTHEAVKCVLRRPPVTAASENFRDGEGRHSKLFRVLHRDLTIPCPLHIPHRLIPRSSAAFARWSFADGASEEEGEEGT